MTVTGARQEVALVTGAGSPDGIGFATARRLAARGAAVLVTSTTQRIHDRVAELRATGADAHGLVVDLTEAAAATRVVQSALAQFGGLDVVVNNAGLASLRDRFAYSTAAALADTSDYDWRAALARNLDTAFYVMRSALALMRPARYGRIVNVSSVSGPVLAYRGDAGYHAAKAGLVGLTRSAAVDVAADGITVNAVAPGWIETGSSTDHELQMGAATPVGRPGTADEVAGLIGYLTGRDAGYVTGQVFIVDGGNSIMEERG